MAVVLLTGCLSFSEALGQEPSGRGTFVRYDFDQRASRVREFWTRARMRSAPPMPELEALDQEQTDGWSTSLRSTQAEVLRSSLLQDAPFERSEITDPAAYPYRVHGKLFVKVGRLEYHCSATVVESANESVVITAAHCLYGSDLGGWVESAAFVPGYRFGDRPYGTWVASSAFVTPAWLTEATPRGDIGALVMEPLDGASLVDTVGGRSMAFDQEREQHFEAFGYPAEGEFDGERLYVCSADAFARDASPSGTGPDTMGIGCDMTGGSSGGGWVIDGEALNSVNSYGYQNEEGEDLPYMFGPYFGSMASELYERAESVPVDTPEPMPSMTPTPTDVPNSAPSPTAVPSVSPSPTPSAPASRTGATSDRDDSRGRFDIASVTVTESGGQITIDLVTHDDWGPRLLSESNPRNRFFVDFDSVGGAKQDYYLGVFSRNGRLVGKIYEYVPGRDRVVGRATLSRATRNGFSASILGASIDLNTKLRWYASSYFKSHTRCQTGCLDFAPNRTMVEL